MAILRHLSVAAALTILNLPWYTGPITQADTVGDHLWIWGHPAGSYNDGFLRPMKLVSKIEPVDAALYMGLKNLIFVRYSDKPAPPFDAYYNPFRKLDRVYWSLVGAGGGSSSAEREAAFTLAEKNKNLAGFILDDFFHEQCEGNAADPLGIVDSPDRPLRASLDPAQLRALRQRQVRGRKLPLMAVIYTRQVKPGARPHIAEVDQLCMWTWRPDDLKR
jgi:hypothetical protein